MSIWRYANPAEFMRVTRPALAPLWVLTIAVLGTGLIWGVVFTPKADLFGATVKIIFVHVPAALIAINTYILMAVASAIGYVRRHHVSFLIAKAAAPIGIVFTVIAVVTGAIWGQPTWGTWWVWDARLTAFLILFFFYLGYIALWAAIEEPEKAADLSAVLCMVGIVFALLARYAFLFWSTLHQDASLTADPGQEQQVNDVYRTPLYICMLGFYFLFFALLLVRTRTEIRLRRARALRLSGAVA